MWFKNIANWEQSKLRKVFWIYKSIYLIGMLLIPIIIIASRYDLIKNSSTRLTGIGLILVVCFAVYVLESLKNFIKDMAEITKAQQIVKFTSNLVFSLVIPVLIIIAVQLIKQNVELACDTILYCMISIIASIILDNIAVKYLEAERHLRKEAQKKLEIDKRADAMKN